MLDWQDIHTVLLDMDGTLLDLHFDNHFWLEHLPKRYIDIHRHNDEQAARQLLAQRFEAERGTLNWYCTDYWSEQLQLDVPALKLEIQHLIAIRPYVVEFLARLRAGPQQVILVTNAHRQSLDIKMKKTGLSGLFDDIVVSHDLHTAKEDHRFWQQLHNSHPFDPQHTLLIDDTKAVLESAHAFGIKHLLTLLQPDSKQQQRQQTDFPGILHFDEIMPALEPSANGQA